jgi:hypothetical protein
MASSQPRDSGENESLDSTWSNATKLSSKLREIAHRSHRVLKAGPVSPESPDDIVDALRELRDQVARLHRKIHERHLEGLYSWVDALQQQVDERFGGQGKSGTT